MVGLKFGLCVIAKFRKFRGTRIMDGYVVGVVTVVLWALFLHCYVLRHMCSVLLLFLCCILLFVRLKEFCLLMMKKFQKILQIVCVLHLLVYLLVCVKVKKEIL